VFLKKALCYRTVIEQLKISDYAGNVLRNDTVLYYEQTELTEFYSTAAALLFVNYIACFFSSKTDLQGFCF